MANPSRPSEQAESAPVLGAASRGAGAEPVESTALSPLRLTVARGKLGMELYEARSLGPLCVTGLQLTLPNLSFPVDLSGGVPLFRHRRGRLEQLSVGAHLSDLIRWATPHLREILGGLERPVAVWGRDSVVGLGLVNASRALAFELAWVPELGDARFVVDQARGAGLDGAALGYALRAADALFGSFCEREGRIVHAKGAARAIAQAVMPPLGARVPSSEVVNLGALEWREDWVGVDFDVELPAVCGAKEAIALLELARSTRGADDELARGDSEAARAGYLRALESTPRHPDLVQLVAEIDTHQGGRDEAALGLLVEGYQATRAGWVGAELLRRRGDHDGAREALADAAGRERFSPLAALLWLALAESQPDVRVRRESLDRAVGRAPDLRCVRWARFHWRVGRGELEGAVADAQQLEASASGVQGRRQTCLEVATQFAGAALPEEAAEWFERALRFTPDDPEGTAGLAEACVARGDLDHALALYERAVRLAGDRHPARFRSRLEYSRLLAEHARDLPQAISVVRRIPASAGDGALARYLEGHWRALLGDLAGASLAYARCREGVELLDRSLVPPQATAWLVAAASFERTVLRDYGAAERHLMVALGLAPRDPQIQASYREVAATLADSSQR